MNPMMSTKEKHTMEATERMKAKVGKTHTSQILVKGTWCCYGSLTKQTGSQKSNTGDKEGHAIVHACVPEIQLKI